MKTPFHKNGKLKSPLRAILDRCIIWPLPAPEKVGSIEIPSVARKQFNINVGIGVLLSVGPGFNKMSGKWISTPSQLTPGCLVRYDETVPWGVTEKDHKGKRHFLVICGVQDVQGVVDE